MNIFKRWRAKKDSVKIIKIVNDHCKDGQISINEALMITDELNKIKTPINVLNDEVGDVLMKTIISSSYSQPGVDLLALVLDEGLPVSSSMLQRLQHFNVTVTNGFDYDGQFYCEYVKQKNMLCASETAQRFLQVVDLLTSFGANWSTPSTLERQYPTVLDYLYHQTQGQHPSISSALRQFYGEGEPQQNNMLSSQAVLRKRIEALFADEKNDIMIETGECVKISTVAKTPKPQSPKNRMTQ